MSVKYSWSRQNGAAVPPVRFMSIEPAEDYYKGMPLKLKEKGIVEPTDGDPEYICMAQYDPGTEIQPLEIPVQEVFPDVVYDRMNEDGTIEEVRFGSKGGGGAILDSNGKLKSEVLPEGYPYEETTTSEPQTYNYAPVEKSSGNPCHADGYFPADSPIFQLGGDGFQEGQLVRVNYDGVNYDCVVRYAHFNWWIGNPTLTKDSSENGSMDHGIDYIEESEHYVDSGEPFCYIVHNYYNTRYALFTLDTKPRTVTFTPMEKEIIPMAEKFLPPGIGGGSIKTAVIKIDGYDNALAGIAPAASAPEETWYTCENMTFDEAKQIMLKGEPLAVMIKYFNNFGIGCRYSNNVLINRYNGCIIFGDSIENMDIWWGPKGICTDEHNVYDA